MAVSMVNGREFEQELEKCHLMLKNYWLCFRISSTFVGNNSSLQIHSFSEDWGKHNRGQVMMPREREGGRVRGGSL